MALRLFEDCIEFSLQHRSVGFDRILIVHEATHEISLAGRFVTSWLEGHLPSDAGRERLFRPSTNVKLDHPQ